MALFGLRKKQNTFGLDIGSSVVKVVELAEGRAGEFALQSFATMPMPRDIIAEGTIKDPAVVTEATTSGPNICRDSATCSSSTSMPIVTPARPG